MPLLLFILNGLFVSKMDLDEDDVALESRRKELISRTMKDVIDILNRVVSIRFSESKSNLAFSVGSNVGCYQVDLDVSSACVQSGRVTIIQMSNSQTTSYEVGTFPILFMHQIARLASHLLHEVSYIAANVNSFDMQAFTATVDRLIREANQILCVFSDPKFTEQSINSHFVGGIPSHLQLLLQYRDGQLFMKYSGLVGSADMTAPNTTENGCEVQFKEAEKCLHSVVKSLKYLRSDACSWTVNY